jgi:hypothetical protein
MAEHLITSFGENWTQVSRVAFVHVRRKPGLSLPHRATDMDVLFFLLEYRGRSRAGVTGSTGSRCRHRRIPRSNPANLVATPCPNTSKWPPRRAPPFRHAMRAAALAPPRFPRERNSQLRGWRRPAGRFWMRYPLPLSHTPDGHAPVIMALILPEIWVSSPRHMDPATAMALALS